MAGELPPVVAKFIGDVQPLLDDIKKLRDTLSEAAVAADELQKKLDQIGQSGAAALLADAAALKQVRDNAAEAAAEVGHLRDNMLEADAAAKGLGDHIVTMNQGLKDSSSALRDIQSAADALGGKDGGGGGGAGTASLLSMLTGGTSGGLLTGGVTPAASGIMMAIPAILGILPVLGDAAAGFGALGIAGKSTISMMMNMVNGATLTKAQLAKLDPTTRLMTEAYQGNTKALDQLNPSQKALVENMLSAQTAYQNFQNALQPQILILAGTAMKILADIMPTLTKLAEAAAPPLEKMFQAIDSAVKSPAFAAFIQKMVDFMPQAITYLMTFLGNVVKFVAELTSAGVKLAPFINAVIELALHILTLAAAFASAHPKLVEVLGIITFLAGAFIMLSTVTNPLVALIVAVAAALAFLILKSAGFRSFWLGLWHDVGPAVMQAVHSVEDALRPLFQAFMNVVHAVENVVNAFRKSHGQVNAETTKMVEQVIAALDKLAVEVVIAIVRMAAAVVVLFIRLSIQVDRIVGQIALKVLETLAMMAAQALSGITSWIARMVSDFVSMGARLVSAVIQAAERVVSEIRNMGSRMVAAVMGLIGVFLSAGYNLMMGLLHGLESGAGTILGYVEGFAKQVSGIISSIWHMLSPSRVTYEHGKNFMLGLYLGMKDHAPLVTDLVSNFATSTGNSIGAGSYAAGARGSASATGSINVQMDGQTLFRIMKSELYRYNINNSGSVNGTWVPV